MNETSPALDAWDRLCDDLRAAADVIRGPIGAINERERAEGVRHLARLFSIGHEMLVEKGDPTRPSFTRWMRPWRKVFGDNPRTIYDAAIVDGSTGYRLHGQRGTTTYLGICAYGTVDDRARRIVANLDDSDLTIGPDGAFQVWIGPDGTAPDGMDHLVTAPDVTDIMVRQYVHDPDAEVEGTYVIEAAEDAGPPPPLTEATIAHRLAALGAWIREAFELEATLSALSATVTESVFRHGREFVTHDDQPAPPPMDLEVVKRVMPTPAIQYAGQWFDDLGDDEAIVVTGAAPPARYWSIQLLTRWMESGDWEHHPVFLTGRDVTLDGDGRFRVVVAHDNPGAGDWLATTGLCSANLAVRALLSDDLLDVQFERVSLPLDG